MSATPKKDLRYFMREQKEEIITAPAPESFKDADGNPIKLEIRVLTHREIQKINDNYKTREIATDSNGTPYLGTNNEVVFKTDRDSARASRHIIVEALVYPNLKDPELMEYYKCHDVTEMPLLVFSKPEEYSHISKVVLGALGLGPKPTDDEEVADAKN